MRALNTLAGVLFLLLVLSLPCQAQAPQWFNSNYGYSDVNGTGTLRFQLLSSESTRLAFQSLTVTLDINANHYAGSGVYHSFGDDPQPLAQGGGLIAFTLSYGARSLFYQAQILSSAPGTPNPGPVRLDGTYFFSDTPWLASRWMAVLPSVGTGAVQIINAAPGLASYWSTSNFSEAVGGIYWGTANTLSLPDSTATWGGTLPIAGKYQVEVFVPRQPAGMGSLPRTSHAVYTIWGTSPQTGSPSMTVLPTVVVNQQVASSQWVNLGTFVFTNTYKIVLDDTTWEPLGSHSVVANAVRLTYQP